MTKMIQNKHKTTESILTAATPNKNNKHALFITKQIKYD